MSYTDFLSALSVYVRTDEEDGSLTDTRHDRVAELAGDDVPEEMLAEMAHCDLAAMLSGSVCVRHLHRADRLVEDIFGDDEDGEDGLENEVASATALALIQRFVGTGNLPLLAKQDGVSDKVLVKLIKTEAGCLTYMRVLKLLTMAAHEGVPGIYRLPKVKATHDLITAPMDPESRDLD